MDFLGALPMDVRWLLIGGALALLAALFSGTKRNEHRYVALFTVIMAVAGYRFHVQGASQQAIAGSPARPAVTQAVTVTPGRSAPLRSTSGNP